MDINVGAVKSALIDFIQRHRVEFERLPDRQTQLLELGVMALVVEHYRLGGYQIRPQNLQAGRFRVNASARGLPWNFSWFEASRSELSFQIHSNLAVSSAYGEDGGIYVVDVGVVRPGSIPTVGKKRRRREEKWHGIQNHDLLTLVEAKKLVIYPMLLAQFVGIVHEIKPTFLGHERPEGFVEAGHFDPALASIGYLQATSAKIRAGYRARRFHLCVVPCFDEEIAKLRGGQIWQSPLKTQ